VFILLESDVQPQSCKPVSQLEALRGLCLPVSSKNCFEAGNKPLIAQLKVIEGPGITTANAAWEAI